MRSGTRFIKMTMAPEKIPEEPEPAIARPTMKTVELGGAAQMIEPITKRAMEEIKYMWGYRRCRFCR